MPGNRWFYGWTVVAATFVVTFVGFGLAYTFAAFFPPLQREFGAARGTVSLLFSLSGFLYFGITVVTGPLTDRFGPRRVLIAGMAFLAAGLVLASQAQTLWQVCAAYGAGVGLGVGCIYVPAIGTVQRWFNVKRGLATGLGVAGVGAGTMVMPVAAGLLIDATTWREAYLLLALVPVTLGLAGALLMEASPEQRGLLPDGRAPAFVESGGAAAPPKAVVGPSIRVAVASRPFWLIYLAAFLSCLGLYTPVAHLAAYATDHGISEHTALWLVSLIGIGSMIGRLAMGGIADRWGRRRSFAMVYAWMAGLFVYWLASSSVWALTGFAFLFGLLGWGAFVAIFPAISADYFGGPNGTGIFGQLITSLALGLLLGPALAGFAFDLTGNYAVPITVCAAANLIAAVIMLLVEPSEQWRARVVDGANGREAIRATELGTRAASAR